jgi:flagellar basal-body rod protein FlgB
MRVDFLQDQTLEAMGRYMDRLSRRQQVVASNIANIDTPGYRARDISFHATMQELLGGSQIAALASRPEHRGSTSALAMPAEPEVFEVAGLRERSDQNNVDLDQEMLNLGQTTFGFAMMAQLLRVKFRAILGSINEGRIG